MRTSLNINKLIDAWLPELLRKPKLVAFLQSGLKPMQTLHTTFLTYRDAKLYEATITGETNRLEKALQDKFGAGIYIIHPVDYLDTAYIYLETEPRQLEHDYLESENYQPKEYDFLESEYTSDFDFIVQVPDALESLTNEIKTQLVKYALYSKRYTIILY